MKNKNALIAILTILMSFLGNGVMKAETTGTKIVGGDLSLVPAYVAAGDSWLKADGTAITTTAQMLDYVKGLGWNSVRVRLFVDPSQDSDAATCQDINYVKTLGAAIKSAGLNFLLDIHYSDTWADPSNQKIPTSWNITSNMDIADKVYSYTKEVLNTLTTASATPDFVQIGNEINGGMLWTTTDGKYPSSDYATYGYCPYWTTRDTYSASWERLCRLLHAGSKAVRELCPNAKIIVHNAMEKNTTSTCYSKTYLSNFYSYITQSTDYPVYYDIIGLSYYPAWHGTLDYLGQTISALQTALPTKEIQIVETGWYNSYFPTSGTSFSEDNLGWTASALGQYNYLTALTAKIKGSDYSHVTGLYYWQPEECGSGSTSNPVISSDWDNRGLWVNGSNGSHALQSATLTETKTDISTNFSNLDFENGTTEWTTVTDKGFGEHKTKTADDWTSSLVSGTFAQAWASSTVSEGDIIYRTLTVDNGTYEITAAVHAEANGFYLEANNNKTEVKSTSDWAVANTTTVRTTVTDGNLKIGIYSDAQETTGLTVYYDNFTVSKVEGGSGTVYPINALSNFSTDNTNDFSATKETIADESYIGTSDYLTGWWSAFSDTYTLGDKQQYHFNFINHNAGTDNVWNNWVLYAVNSPTDKSDAAQYFGLRNDNWELKENALLNGLTKNSSSYSITGDESNFIADMNGATVDMYVTYTKGTSIAVNATITATDGDVYTYTYTYDASAVTDDNVYLFLTVDHSYIDLKTAEKICTVSFDAGDNGTCETSSLAQVSITLPEVTANTGYAFVGWFNSSNIRIGGAGDTYTPTANETLTAHYASTTGTCIGAAAGTVSFNTQKSAEVSINSGDTWKFKFNSYGRPTYSNSGFGNSWNNWVFVAGNYYCRADNWSWIDGSTGTGGTFVGDWNGYLTALENGAPVEIVAKYTGSAMEVTGTTTYNDNTYSVSYSSSNNAGTLSNGDAISAYVTLENAYLTDYSAALMPTITFNDNAEDATGTMGAQVIDNNEATTLSANTFTRSGYTFAGWATSADGDVVYADQAGVTLTANQTLYAVWNSNSFAVTSSTEHAVGTVLTNDSKNIEVTLGGWVYSGGNYTNTDSWNSASKASSTSGYLAGYQYSVAGSQDPKCEIGGGTKPESNEKTVSGCVDYMFQVPVGGTYLTFAPKVNGTLVAHVRQTGLFAVSNGSYTYQDTRRVMIVDEQANSIVKNAIVHIDYDEAGMIDNLTDLTIFKRWSDDGANLTAKYSKATGLEYDSNNQLTSFKNGVFEYTKESGYATYVEAPVTYTFDVKAGKSYYMYLYGAKIALCGFEFTPTKTSEDAALELSQTSDTNAETLAAANGKMVTVNLTDREFTKGIWNSCVLPFSMNKQQVEAIFGKLYDKSNADGTRIIYYDRIENGDIVFYNHAQQTIVAGIPFLIKPAGSSNDGKIKLNTADITDFPYVTIENSTPAAWGKSGSKYWVSSYSPQTITAGDYYIGASSGNLIRRTAADITCNGFRGFLQLSSTNLAKSTLHINFDGCIEDEVSTDGINNLVMDSEGNFYEVPANGTVYNLNGQAVSNDASRVFELPAGIYVVNGKKYIVK